MASVNPLFGAIKSNRNADLDEYPHFGYGIEFDTYWFFSLSFNSGFDKNGILIGVENSSLMYSDTLGRSLIETQCPIKFTKQQNKFCLHYNENDSFQCSKN